LSPVEDLLTQHSTFFNFSKYYLGIHKTIPSDFEVNDAVLNEFKAFLAKDKVAIADQDLNNNLDFIKTHIKIELVGSIFGKNEADKILVANDPLVLKALDDMPQAKELVAKAKRYVASKAQR
jgi:carboxyl-terminal processing protease